MQKSNVKLVGVTCDSAVPFTRYKLATENVKYFLSLEFC